MGAEGPLRGLWAVKDLVQIFLMSFTRSRARAESSRKELAVCTEGPRARGSKSTQLGSSPGPWRLPQHPGSCLTHHGTAPAGSGRGACATLVWHLAGMLGALALLGWSVDMPTPPKAPSHGANRGAGRGKCSRPRRCGPTWGLLWPCPWWNNSDEPGSSWLM